MDTMTIADACVRATSTLNVLLVGGRPLGRERMRKLLGAEPGFSVAAAPSVDRALKAIPGVSPDVVIVNMSGAPLARTMRALDRLSARGCRARTILLTSAVDSARVAQARDLGVSSVLSRTATMTALIDNVRLVAAGRSNIGRDPFVPRARQTAGAASRFGLTRREMEVVEAVVHSYLSSLN